MNWDNDHTTLRDAYHSLQNDLSKANQMAVLPTAGSLDKAIASLASHLPPHGVGLSGTVDHLLKDVLPGFNASSTSPNYYGFVTGGTTPAAAFADNVVTACDQNVAVHLPKESIATIVEDRAAILLLQLLNLDPDLWIGRTFTTGATASNILGVSCGRDSTINKACQRRQGFVKTHCTVSEAGIFSAMSTGGISKIQILTTLPHSSLLKAASLVGIGHASVKVIGQELDPLAFDMGKLNDGLRAPDTATIVVISCGEVNTGRFATSGYDQLQHIRSLCDEYDAWLHIDGAFGIFGRALEPCQEFEVIVRGSQGIELADSITGDTHKLLNVPYDCGFFLCRHPDIVKGVCQNPNAAYLNSGEATSIVSPLNHGIENSRRFRALPVYATLNAYGRSGYRAILMNQVRLARAVASYIMDHSQLELCQKPCATEKETLANIFIIVLFRANDSLLNKSLVQRINSMSKIYVSGTFWEGRPATRIAVSNWRCDEARDICVIREVLDMVVNDFLQKG